MPKVPVKKEVVPESGSDLNGFDRLYLTFEERDITGLFNELCYEDGIHSIEDLKSLKRKSKTRHANNMIEIASKEHDFHKLAKKHGKVDYAAELAQHGVPIVPFSDVQVLKKVGTGPLSGVACGALLNQNGKKTKVCLRYPRNDLQLQGFINEAKMLAMLQHPNILKLYGVVVPGAYCKTLALLVEFIDNGNVMEALDQLTAKKFCQMMPQILEVLHFLDSKGYVHTRLSEFAVFMLSSTQIKIGGFGGVFPKGINSSARSFISNPSVKNAEDMIAWFGYFVEKMFLMMQRSHHGSITYTVKKDHRFSYYCPEVLFPLLNRCGKKKKGKSEVPTFEEFFQVLRSKDFQTMVKIKTSYKAQHKNELSVYENENIFVMSKSLIRKDHDPNTTFWLGEKDDGSIGWFNGDLAIPIADSSDVLAASEDDTQVPVEIKARGAHAEFAYHRALKHGKIVINRGRIMLVGQERAGKTSLKNSLLGLPFNPGQESTVGVEVDPSCCSVDVDNVKNWQRTTDCGQMDFADNIARLIADDLKHADNGVVEEEKKKKEQDIKKDIEDGGKEEIKEEQLQQITNTSEEKIISDDTISSEPEHQKEDVQEKEEGQEPHSATKEPIPDDVTEKLVLHLQGMNLDDSSKKSQTIVSIWDFAGQHLYYASHPVFMSPRALYLIVYNLAKDLNSEAEPCVRQGAFDIFLDNVDHETNLEAILSWLASIHSIRPVNNQEDESEDGVEKKPGNDTDPIPGIGGERIPGHETARKLPGKVPYLRPPVIIVGTHADAPCEQPKKLEICIKKSLSGKSFQQHIVKPFFTVSNKLSSGDRGIQELQAKIIEVLEMEPYMGEDIPVRWLIFEKAIEALIEKETTHHLQLPDLKKIIQEVCFIEDNDEIDAMLDYYHDLGVIIKHGGTVVLQTQWLIDLFRKLITVRPYDDQNPMFEECWNDLEEYGILRMELVEHVFGELLNSGQTKEDLLAMMEHYGLIARFDKGPDPRYFVPAQLRSSPEELIDTQPSPFGPCALYIHFTDGFVPHGLYSYFISKLIGWYSKSESQHEPNLYRNVSRFIIGKSSDYELILICRKRFIKIVLRSLQEGASSSYQPAVSVRQFVETTLGAISVECNWYRSLKYELSVLCPSCSNSNKPCTKHRVVGCHNDDCIHLLEVCHQQVLVCTKSFGKDARPEMNNLSTWYPTQILAEGAIPKSKLMCIAHGIGERWKVLGRGLSLSEADLDEIEEDEDQLYERCYSVLKRWTESEGSAANYEALVSVLTSDAVQMSDLAVKYCGVVVPRPHSAICSDEIKPEVFLSYQWDIQPTAIQLSKILKEKGFNCWVDIGQMGGGDALYAQIDKGITESKVVISCVTARYCASENCQREATLADLRKKPIIPLLLEPILWPPEGQLGPIFAKLLYIDMTQGFEAKIDDLIKRIESYSNQ